MAQAVNRLTEEVQAGLTEAQFVAQESWKLDG